MAGGGRVKAALPRRRNIRVLACPDDGSHNVPLETEDTLMGEASQSDARISPEAGGRPRASQVPTRRTRP